jgi:outer membrane protein assembly factor BamA
VAPVELDSVFGLVPDTVYGLVGAFAEYRRARYHRVDRLNGFTEEDQDLSDLVFVSVKLAAKGLGYASTGVGARVRLQTGARLGRATAKGLVDANGLFNAAGLDSGRVFARGTLALKPHDRHATFVQVTGGVLDRPPPGGEFDLGFEILPRLWGPHAFVGTRSLSATFEHRIFVASNIADLVGAGIAGFVDYGGAWYAGQNARYGGNAGLSVFFGSPLSSFAQVTHVSGGYRFGGGLSEADEPRWAFSLGSGIRF